MSLVRPSSSSKKRRKSGTPEARSKKSTSSKKLEPSGSHTASTHEELTSAKNTFELPAEYGQDPGRFEFWTVRLPSSVSLKDVEGCQITVHTDPEFKPEGDKEAQVTINTTERESETDAIDEDDAKSGTARTYTVCQGSEVENKSLRMLISQKQLEASQTDGSSDDDDDGRQEDDHVSKKEVQKLAAISHQFTHHVNVLEHHAAKGELELAPPHTDKPSLAKGTVLKRAYTPVAQKTGLKRRWKPIGLVVQQADKTNVNADTTMKDATPIKRKVEGRQEDESASSPNQHYSRKRKASFMGSDGDSNHDETPAKAEENASLSAATPSTPTRAAPSTPHSANGNTPENLDSEKKKREKEQKKSAKKEKKAAKKLAKKGKKAAKLVKRESV